MVGAVCEEYPLVPRFEGEEDDRCETTDLPVADSYPTTPVEFPIVRMVDRTPKLMFERIAEVPPSFVNPLVGFAKFFEGLESRYDTGVVFTFVFGRLEPFSVAGSYAKGQGDAKNAHKDEGLTWFNTVHLECPPGNVFEACREMCNVVVVNSQFGQSGAAEGCQVDIWSTYGKKRLTLGDVVHLERPPGIVFDGSWFECALLIASLIAYRVCHVVALICRFGTQIRSPTSKAYYCRGGHK